MRPLPLLAALLLVLVLPLPAEAQAKDWTFLVYMDADNNLEDVGIEDFLEMAAVGSTDRVNVVVQFDRSGQYTRAYGDWTTAKRYYVQRGTQPDAASALQDLGEVNMANPAELVSFVNWGIANYPARHYFLALWDHGDGWQGVVIDDDPVLGDRLTASELRTALQAIVAANGRRIDLLGNDACRMSLEIQYELADYVDYFVGSEKDEPLAGWPYDAFLEGLVANPAASPGDVARMLVDAYVESYAGASPYSVALSAVSAAGLRAFVPSFNTFLDEVAVHEPYFTAEVIAGRSATERYEIGGVCCGDEYDLYDFVGNVLERVPSRRLERSAQSLLAAIGGAVLHERHWDNATPINGVHARDAHGLSIWFGAGGDPAYEQLALSRDTRWDEFLLTYASGTRPQVAANALATTADADGDGYRETLLLRFEPEIDGTMAVDVYRDSVFGLGPQFVAIAGRADEVQYRFPLGGYYEVTFYLLDAGDLVNLTRIPGLTLEELIPFRGRVFEPSGGLIEGANVTLVNLRTGDRVSTTTTAGLYSIRVPYPTWFQEGDELSLEVRAGGLVAYTTFPATLDASRAFAYDLTLGGAPTPWYLVALVLAVVAAIGLAGTLYFYWRWRRFKTPP